MKKPPRAEKAGAVFLWLFLGAVKEVDKLRTGGETPDRAFGPPPPFVHGRNLPIIGGLWRQIALEQASFRLVRVYTSPRPRDTREEGMPSYA